jgi:hypothetical protein
MLFYSKNKKKLFFNFEFFQNNKNTNQFKKTFEEFKEKKKEEVYRVYKNSDFREELREKRKFKEKK